MSWLIHHTQSEEYVSQAEELNARHDHDRAADFYRLAAEAETYAIESLAPSKTRTISITAVSAVSLYYKAKELAQARRAAHKWLATELLAPFAIDELEDMLQMIRYEESRAKSGIQFIEGEVLVSVSGGEILYGAAPLELILEKVDRIKNIFYRTTELLLEQPLRTRGAPSQNIKSQCDPWLFQAPAGSYQFEVRVRKPQDFKQLGFAGMENVELRVEQITKKFLEIVRATAQDPEGKLAEVVPQEDYRKAFLKLTRELAPPASGKSFDQIKINSSNDIYPYPVVLSTDTRKVIKQVLKKPEVNFISAPDIALQQVSARKVVQLKGILRGLQLDSDWIEVSINGKNERIYDAEDEIDDVIGPMVNRQVVVEVLESSNTSTDKRYSLRDIQLEDDLP